MNIVKKITLLFYLFCSAHNLYAQGNVDSFINVIQQETDTTFFSEFSLDVASLRGYNNYEKELLVDQCIKRTKELKLELIHARYIFRKSIYVTINGNFHRALSMLNEAMPVFEKHQDILYLVGSYNTSGNMISRLGDIDRGVAYLRKAISLIDQSDVSPQKKLTSKINCNSVLGNIFFLNNESDSSIKYYNIANKLCDQQADKHSKERGFATMNVADVEYGRKRYKASLEKLRETLKVTQGRFSDIESMAYGKIGSNYTALKEYDSASYYLNKSQKLAEEGKSIKILLSILQRKKVLHEKTNNISKAYETLEYHNQLKKTVDSTEKSALSVFMISQTKRQEQKEANYKLGKEKVKQRTLQIWLIAIIGLTLLLSLIAYFLYQRKQLKQQLEKDRVEKEMIKSQIRAINSQMNPHFVFNSLNSIQELIVTNDIRNSNIYLGKFADLMRKTLEYSQEDEIYLNQELDVLKLYLDLEQKRFGEDLKIEINNVLPEEQLSQIKVPSMLFQPYVENALKHGLLHKEGEKKLSISLKEKANQLIVTIEDNGIGRTKSAELNDRGRKNHKSYALNANQNRLDLIKYSSGREIDVKFIDLQNNGGTRVEFRFTQEAIE